MKNKIKISKRLLLASLFVALCGIPVAAQTSDTSEVDELKAQMQAMQTNMDEMHQRINELEQEKAAAAVVVPSGTNASLVITNANAEVIFATPTQSVVVMVSPIMDRGNLQDYQLQAPRLDNETLNEKYQGFVPIPNTPGIIQFNAKPRLDMMWDNRYSGNPDRFVTATIPTGLAAGGGNQFNINARGSSLSIDVRAPTVAGDFRFYYNNDFFGSGSGMSYRLKQLYGEFYNVTAGFTFSIFEDPDVWPDTVDFEGPNSMIFARQPTVRYMLALDDHWQLNFGLQQPSSDIDNEGSNSNAAPNNQAPDGGFNIRWEDKKWGHVQFATIFRDVGARGTTLGQQNVFGWGLNLSANLNLCEHDSVQGQITYGDGIFHFCNDNFTYSDFNGGDAAFNNAGQLRALQYVAPMVGYTHQWCDAFRSTATFGYVNLQNEQAQSGVAYHQTYYASGNLIWQVRKRLSIGLECLYGKKVDNDGTRGDVWRVQTGLVYTLFK